METLPKRILKNFILGLVLFLFAVQPVVAAVQVQGYYRSNGTYVQPYVRSSPTPAPKLVPTPSAANLYAPSKNTYYINSTGNKVLSPVFAPAIPLGASAKCRDSSYSFSQHRSGTCSGHGGVSQWY